MKKTKLFVLLCFIAFNTIGYAQICNPPCIPDPTCVDTDNPGEVCPLILPPAFQGVYYDETVTIIPPATYEGLPVIHSVKITHVSGLPEGIEWCKSNDVFTVTTPATSYCCQLYGTANVPGEYPLSLTIVPYINVFGFPVAQDPMTDDTSLVIIVLPPGPLADFSANNLSADTLEEISFIDNSLNNPTSWEWTFENGTPAQSNEQNPVVFWENVGQYDVSLTVTNEAGNNTKTVENFITISENSSISSSILSNVKIYPNPTSDQITIEAEKLESIDIVDILGKIVFSAKATQDKMIVDVSKLNKATYFVKIKTENGKITKTISVK